MLQRVWSLNAFKTGLCAILVLAHGACGNAHPTPGVTFGGGAPRAKPQAPADSAPREAPDIRLSAPQPRRVGAPSPAEPTPGDSLLPFPTELPIHTPLDVPLVGDRNLRVAHAPGDSHKAVVYLHGMCGDPKGADPWVDLATKYATVVTVRANVKCPDRPGYKWPQEPEEIQPRIDAALAHVKKLRNGHLKTDEVTLIGYSQGSHRAEKLAAAYPEMYLELVLGGPPTAADSTLLKRARAVAILGGELEDTTHMVLGHAHLQTAGIRSKFFLLPHAHHGTYGPEGRRVMTEVLTWIWPTPE